MISRTPNDPNDSWQAFEFFAPRQEGPIAIAHRGGAGEGDENSLEALRHTASIGVRYVEIDLRATNTGQLVLWHGKGPQRLRPNQTLNTAGLDPSRFIQFEDVLEELPSDTRFFVDLKNKPAVPALATVVAHTGTARRICVGSFSHGRTVPAVAAIAQRTEYRPCSAMTPRQVARLLIHATRPRIRWETCAVSAQIPAWMASRRVIDAAHAGGALVFAWTVNDERVMSELLDRGVDGLMTDFPSRLVQLLDARTTSKG